MSVENVKMFYEAVSQDEALKQRFIELSQKYQGQPMDEVRVWSIMEQEALPLAAQMGYSFTIDDVKSYDLAMQQAKIGCAMSDEELQAVSGGGAYLSFCCCVGIDLGTGKTDQAFICVFVGITIFSTPG